MIDKLPDKPPVSTLNNSFAQFVHLISSWAIVGNHLKLAVPDQGGAALRFYGVGGVSFGEKAPCSGGGETPLGLPLQEVFVFSAPVANGGGNN